MASTWTILHGIYKMSSEVYAAAYSDVKTQWCDVYTAAYTTFTLTTDVYTAWHLERHPQEEVVSTRPSLDDIYK